MWWFMLVQKTYGHWNISKGIGQRAGKPTKYKHPLHYPRKGSCSSLQGLKGEYSKILKGASVLVRQESRCEVLSLKAAILGGWRVYDCCNFKNELLNSWQFLRKLGYMDHTLSFLAFINLLPIRGPEKINFIYWFSSLII